MWGVFIICAFKGVSPNQVQCYWIWNSACSSFHQRKKPSGINEANCLLLAWVCCVSEVCVCVGQFCSSLHRPPHCRQRTESNECKGKWLNWMQVLNSFKAKALSESHEAADSGCACSAVSTLLVGVKGAALHLFSMWGRHCVLLHCVLMKTPRNGCFFPLVSWKAGQAGLAT